MGFTVRFMLGTLLVLLCFWSVQTTTLNRPQIGSNESQEKAENSTVRSVANLKDESKPKTDFSTEDNKTTDKDNKIKSAQQPEMRSIDIDKYVSKEFHNKNNVYTLPTSPDNEKFLNPDFAFHETTHKHESFDFDYNTELTTPRSSIFDEKYKERVENIDQQLEHIDSDENSDSKEFKEPPNLETLLEETKRNDTKAVLDYVSFKNVISNDTDAKNDLHKGLVVEAGSNLDFRSSYNHTTVIDEDDSGNNTIVKELEKKVEFTTLSNIIPAKGDLDHAESSTSKSAILTTRKSNSLTKPPSRNSSHISILSNNIETETVKAINPVQSSTTEKPKGETETVPEVFLNKTPIVVVKRPFMLTEAPRTEAPLDSNNISKKSEQLLQENQVIPVHVEAPPTMSNVTTEIPLQVTIPATSEVTVPTKQDNPILQTTQATTTEEIQTTKQDTTTLETPITEVPTRLVDYKTTTESQISTATNLNQEETTSTKTKTTTEPVTTVTETQTTFTKFIEPQTTTERLLTTTVTETQTIFTKFTEPQTTTERLLELQTTTVPTTLEDLVKNATKQPETTEIETMTSVITETSISPWTKLTTVATTTTPASVETTKRETEGTTVSYSQSDGTTTVETVETTTSVPIQTTKQVLNTETESDNSSTITTENTMRTSKEMVYRTMSTSAASEAPTEPPTTTELLTTTENRTTEPIVEITQAETTTQGRIQELETTTVPNTKVPRVFPEFKNIEHNDSSIDVDNSTENNTSTPEFYETNDPDDNSGTIAAITISSIGAVCLVLLAGLLVIMRKRQKRFNYGQRCTPVSLDDYSMDNVSVHNSVRRKGMVRGSKRSYGNPAFEDPVCVSHPLNFPALGKFANNFEDIKAEFEEIPQITARTNELPDGCDTKNRYANVIPLPETRVFLSLIDGYPNSDYINANYVTGPKNTKGYYIACQGPLQNTVDDFWRMIWEQQCKVILMLTHLFENGVEKCVDYLPPSEVLDCHRLFGDFQVTLKKREVKDKYIISSLQLKNMVSNSWREVTHFWYLGWPEKGVPLEGNSLIAFLIEARSYMKSASLDRKDVTNGNLINGTTKNELNPVVVHCSPGTGRTGVVIACDIAIREFEQTRLVDVPRIVYKIRRDRASAVQTKEQYAFIYKVINVYATKLTGGALDSL